MNAGPWPKDLAVLAADKNIEGTLRGLLARWTGLGLREISSDLYVHPERDPGCLLRGHDFLRPFSQRYAHALIVLDKEGCGRERETRADLELQLETRLSAAGWNDRAAAVVIDPELEVWVWTDSPHVERALGWDQSGGALRDWLRERGWLPEGEMKPTRPKGAIEALLRIAHKPRSSAMFHQLAQRVSTDRCVDPAFLKLRSILSRWFSRE